MLEDLNSGCKFHDIQNIQETFGQGKGRSKKKAGIYPKISTQLSSKCHKWGREREGGFYFFCRCILLAELRGVREDGYPQATKQKWAKCNCSRPFLEMLCRGRMPRHHIENPLSIIKAMIAIGRAMGVSGGATDIHFPLSPISFIVEEDPSPGGVVVRSSNEARRRRLSEEKGNK